MVGLMIVLTLGFAAGAIFTYRTAGWTWVSVGFALATVVLGFGSVIESLVQRIELTDDAVVVTRLTGVQRIPRESIERVAEAKGVAPALLLRSGQWVKLPSVGSYVGNSIRSWLKS
jgi:hypothetical protein